MTVGRPPIRSRPRDCDGVERGDAPPSEALMPKMGGPDEIQNVGGHRFGPDPCH